MPESNDACALFDERLQCFVLHVSYNFIDQQAAVCIAEGNAAHGPGVIALAESICSECSTIWVIAGQTTNSLYYRKNGSWCYVAARGLPVSKRFLDSVIARCVRRGLARRSNNGGEIDA